MTGSQLCPECGGARLWNFTYRHDPAACSVRQEEDATQAADWERLSSQSGTELVREATPTELQLVQSLTVSPVPTDPDLPALTVVTERIGGLRYRVIAGTDPDEDPDTTPTS